MEQPMDDSRVEQPLDDSRVHELGQLDDSRVLDEPADTSFGGLD